MHWLALIVLLASGLYPKSDTTSTQGSQAGYYLTRSGHYPADILGTPTACWSFDGAVAGTLASHCGGSYTLTVTGTPVSVSDGTLPTTSQGKAWDFDGTNDWLSMANGSGGADMIPAGDATWHLVYTPEDVASAGEDIVGVWYNATNNQVWMAQRLTDDLIFYLSKDGQYGAGHHSSLTVNNVFESGMPSVITIAYDYVTDGTSVIYIGVDGTWGSAGSAVGPAYASTSADFTIADRHGGAGNRTAALIHHFAFIDGVVSTQANHNDFVARWQGRHTTDARKLDVESNLSPGVVVSTGNNGGMARAGIDGMTSGDTGLCTPDACTSLIDSGPLESCDGSSHPSNWTTVEGGSSTVDCDATVFFEGHGSVKMVGDATGTAYIQSNCFTVSPSTNYWVSSFAKKASGTADYRILFVKHSDGACGSQTGAATIISGDLTTSWAEKEAVADSGAGTNSVFIRVQSVNNTATIYVDAITVTESDTADASCLCDAAAPCACTTVDVTDSTVPITRGDWCVEMHGSTWVDGAESTTRRLLYVPGTAGNNNRVELTLASDVLTFDVYDSSGTKKTATVACALSADTADTIRVSHTHAGVIWACCAGSCGTTATGATMDGVGSEFVIGSDGTNGGQWCTQSIKVRPRTCSR